MRIQFFVLALVVALIVFALAQPDGYNKEQAARIGFQSPDFALGSLDGQVYSLAANKGKPVVINFWASWCAPCRIEAPELVRLYDKYEHKIEIYAVNLSSDDTLQGATAFAREFQFPFPVLLDEKGNVSKLYRVRTIPTTYFVDRNGKIVSVIIGVVSPDELENQLVRLMKGTEV